MNFTSEEARALAARLYGQQLLLSGLCKAFPEIGLALSAHVDAWESRTLYEHIPVEEIVKHARAIISTSPTAGNV